MPQVSISWSVIEIGSSVSLSMIFFSGTSLNMYSTGNLKSSFDSRSFVWRVMKA